MRSVTPDARAGFQSRPEVNAGTAVLRSSSTAGTRPIFIKIRQSVCHSLSKSTESLCFPGQVFNTRGCSCHQSGDSDKCHSVSSQEKGLSTSRLKSLVCAIIGPPAHQIPALHSSSRAPSGLEVNDPGSLTYTFCYSLTVKKCFRSHRPQSLQVIGHPTAPKS